MKCDLCRSTDDVQGKLCRRHRIKFAQRADEEKWERWRQIDEAGGMD